MAEFEVRFAERSDTPLIMNFIRAMGDYIRKPGDVTATEELLEKNLFDNSFAEVLLAETRGKPAGYAVFFHTFSTFLGKPGLYLEDLFVREEYRGTGCGRKFLSFLAGVAVERGCGRIEWSVLDWNEPSLGFYRSLGAVPQIGSTAYRLTEDDLRRLAGAS